MSNNVCIRHYLGDDRRGATGLLEMNGSGGWSLVVLPCLEREFIQTAVRASLGSHLSGQEIKRDGKVIFRLRERPTIEFLRRVNGLLQDFTSLRPPLPMA